MRYLLVVALSLFFGSAAFARDSTDIGLSVSGHPKLVRMPTHAVYYDKINGNRFFYDGLYWIYCSDTWNQSGWYIGSSQLVEPAYVLSVPARHQRHTPVYFRG